MKVRQSTLRGFIGETFRLANELSEGRIKFAIYSGHQRLSNWLQSECPVTVVGMAVR
jgi:hypothetical protein